jgi:hypothetical protein
MELETHMLMTSRLAYFNEEDLRQAFALAGEVGRMITGLTKRLKTRKLTPDT